MWSSSETCTGQATVFRSNRCESHRYCSDDRQLVVGRHRLCCGELGLSIDQAMAFEKRAADRFYSNYKPGLIYEHIDVNLDVPALQNRRSAARLDARHRPGSD